MWAENSFIQDRIQWDGILGMLMKLMSLVALPASILLGFSAAYAEVSAENRNEADASFEAFAELAMQLSNEPPRWNNPSHADILARFWNTPATIGETPYTEEDAEFLIERFSHANMVLKSYVFFTADSEKQPDILENNLKFQDEISRLTAYNFDLMAAQFEAMTDFAAKLPANEMNEARLDGMRMMQIGGVQMANGILYAARDPELRSENRSIILQALADNADIFAATMSPSRKKDIMVTLNPVLPVLSGSDLENVKYFNAALEHGECNILCETVQE